MRKTLIILGCLLVGLIGLFAAALKLVDVNQFRPSIQAAAETRLHRTVTLGPMSLKLIPLSIRIENVAIGEAPSFGSQAPFLAAAEMYVRVSLAALIRKQIEVESLRITRPKVELIRNREGQWNFETLSPGNTSSAPSSSGNENSGSESFSLSELRIDDGQAAVTDHLLGKPRATYDHIDCDLRDFTPGRNFSLKAAIHLPGNGKEQVDLNANGANIHDLKGTISLQSVSLAGLESFLGSAGLQLSSATITGQSSFEGQGNALTANGALTVMDARVKQPVQVDYRLRQDRQTGVLDVQAANIKLGSLTVTGQGQIASAAIRAEAHTSNASIADVLALAKTFGAATGIDGTGSLNLNVNVQGTSSAPVYSGSGAIRNASLTLPSLRKPVEIQTADIRIDKDHAVLENLVAALGSSHLRGTATVKNFAHPEMAFTADIDKLDASEAQNWSASAKPGAGPAIVLTNIHTAGTFQNGILHADPVTASIFGGQHAGAMTVDTRGTTPVYTMDSKLTNIDANQLLSSTSSIKNILYGTVASNAGLHITNASGQDFTRGLNGDVSLQLTNGKITGFQIVDEMAKLGKFIGYSPKAQAFTKIIKLTGNLKIANGVANTDDLQMEFEGGALSAAGVINLVDETLKLKINTVLAKGGNQKAGGLLTTVLSNSKGEMVIPAIVTGTFAKPRFEPDAVAFAKMQLANPVQTVLGVVGNKDQKGAGVMDIINAFKKKK